MDVFPVLGKAWEVTPNEVYALLILKWQTVTVSTGQSDIIQVPVRSYQWCFHHQPQCCENVSTEFSIFNLVTFTITFCCEPFLIQGSINLG